MVVATSRNTRSEGVTMSEAQLVTGVDFVSVPARDFDEAVRFYGDTLGLERSAYSPDRGFAEFETGNLTLSVIVPEEMGMEHFTSRSPIALHVDDIGHARERLTTAGVERQGDPFTPRSPIGVPVDGMAHARARLTHAGVEFWVDPFYTGVCFMSFFTDPN